MADVNVALLVSQTVTEAQSQSRIKMGRECQLLRGVGGPAPADRGDQAGRQGAGEAAQRAVGRHQGRQRGRGPH